MKLIVYTQIHENYGAHDWDGTGECPQYWKAKGGDDYEIATLTPTQCADSAHVARIIDGARPTIDRNSNFHREVILGHLFLEDGELTESEKDQMEFSGKVSWPRRVWHATEVTS